jgi:ribosome-associated protein
MNEISETVGKIVRILDEKKARDIIVLNVKGLTTITDNFIIATGGSKSQLQALSDHVEEGLAKEGIKPKNREGYNTAEWILIGYDDAIVHIFKEETRSFYNLEHIWKDAEVIDISQFISEN